MFISLVSISDYVIFFDKLLPTCIYTLLYSAFQKYKKHVTNHQKDF